MTHLYPSTIHAPPFYILELASDLSTFHIARHGSDLLAFIAATGCVLSSLAGPRDVSLEFAHGISTRSLARQRRSGL